MKFLYLILAICTPILMQSQLTGFWKSDLGGCYQIRQSGNEVWWAGEHSGSIRAQNVFYGTISGVNLNGIWADLPSNPNQGFGQGLSLRLEGNSKMVKASETAPYLGSVWTKLNGPCETGSPIMELYPEISGTWYRNGLQNMPAYISQNGQNLTFQVEQNTSRGQFTSKTQLYANEWNAGANLSSDHQTITWNNQVWTRKVTATETNYPNIAGTWYQNGNANQTCIISQNGANLKLQLGQYNSIGSFTSQNQITATEWNTVGTLSSDGQTITWGNQTWTRTTSTTGGGENTVGLILEEVYVPSTQKAKTYTQNILELNRTYELVISGTFNYWSKNDPVGVDALYHYRFNPELWSPLYIDDKLLKNHMKEANPPASTAYNEDHIYRLRMVGTGNKLSFYISDGAYADNCGGLTVKIYRL